MATVRMTAQWDGTCYACKKKTRKGSTIEYDYEIKKAYHPECRPGVGSAGDYGGDAESGGGADVAEQLGFIDHAACMASDRVLLLLQGARRSPATRWD